MPPRKPKFTGRTVTFYSKSDTSTGAGKSKKRKIEGEVYTPSLERLARPKGEGSDQKDKANSALPPSFDFTDIGIDTFQQNDYESHMKHGKPKSMGQNALLSHWKGERRQVYLQNMLYLEAPCLQCTFCESEGVFRCVNCLAGTAFCQQCCLSAHDRHPFHRIQKWNGRAYEDSDLDKLGFVFHIGHAGFKCPNPFGSNDVSQQLEDIDEEEEDEVIEPPGDQEDEQRQSDDTRAFRSSRVNIIDSNGIFRRTIAWCGCIDERTGSSVPLDVQLFRQRLFSSSYRRPATAVSFSALEEYSIELFESQTSVQGYYQKLRCFTNSSFPESLSDSTSMFNRIHRQYRSLRSEAEHGFAHEPNREPEPGDSCYRCCACPHPKINAPPSSFKEEDPLWLRRPTWVIDGNFKILHQHIKNPDADVSLRDGRAYMVGQKQYEFHLGTAHRMSRKSDCHNHKAQNAANTMRRDLDATGIAAVVCARHGFFNPHSVADFQVGERQENIDYVVSESIKQLRKGQLATEAPNSAVLVYDIGCQWETNHKTRFACSPALDLPESFEIVIGVDGFHLGAHIEDCYPKFTLNFIPGSGRQDGVILESKWSVLNRIAGITSVMTKAHRQETLDDFINQMNLESIRKQHIAIAKKHARALNEEKRSQVAYDDLVSRVSDRDQERWDAEAEDALRCRETQRHKMAVFDVSKDIVQSFADLKLGLLQKESHKSGGILYPAGAVSFISDCIKLGEMQSEIVRLARDLGAHATTQQQIELEERRSKLSQRIRSLQKRATSFSPPAALSEKSPQYCQGNVDCRDPGDITSSPDEADKQLLQEAETCPLPLPSCLLDDEIVRLGWDSLKQLEITLQQAYAEDVLSKLRLQLGSRAMLYRKVVRVSKSQRDGSRSRASVDSVGLNIRKLVNSYRRSQSALMRLGADPQSWPELQERDLSMKGDFVEQNRTGQSSYELPWFWRRGQISVTQDTEGNPVLEEYYKISYLRANEQRKRWQEEVILTRKEMSWIKEYFRYYRDLWESRAEKSRVENRWNAAGLMAYAQRRASFWEKLESMAEQTFRVFEESKKPV